MLLMYLDAITLASRTYFFDSSPSGLVMCLWDVARFTTVKELQTKASRQANLPGRQLRIVAIANLSSNQALKKYQHQLP